MEKKEKAAPKDCGRNLQMLIFYVVILVINLVILTIGGYVTFDDFRGTHDFFTLAFSLIFWELAISIVWILCTKVI